jgi:GT2 family glycosyltransferase
MKKIAVLLASYNRKNKTVSCLCNLHQAVLSSKHKVNISIYLTDDGNDGTGDAVVALFPEATVLKGSGQLFWAGGMRNSWKEAQKYNYDGYLLLNDDTFVLNNIFDELANAHEFSIAKYGKEGVYIGTTRGNETKKTTYGGTVFINRFFNIYKVVEPNGRIQDCDLGNGNIMYVPYAVFEKIGMFSDKYTHAIADYDYTLTAKRNKIPVLVTANYCGECNHDHANKYDFFRNMNINQRIEFSNSPLGFAFPDMLRYMKKNFPYRLPFFFVAGWIKVLFPGVYILMNKLR